MPSEHDIEIDWSELDLGDPEPAQPVRIEVGTVDSHQANDALIAALQSLSDRQEATDERQAELVQIVKSLAEMVNTDREVMVASLDALAAAVREQPAPVVTVDVPAFPEIVFPDIPPPVVNVQPPEVNVTVETPTTSKKMKVERDPITNLIASVEVMEEVERGG